MQRRVKPFRVSTVILRQRRMDIPALIPLKLLHEHFLFPRGGDSLDFAALFVDVKGPLPRKLAEFFVDGLHLYFAVSGPGDKADKLHIIFFVVLVSDGVH